MPFAIYLNGTSSAGKTILVRALQKAYEEPLLSMGIDLLVREMLPNQFTSMETSEEGFYWREGLDSGGSVVPRLYMGEKGKKIYQCLIHATLGILRGGSSVVINDVAIMGKWQIDLWQKALAPYPSVFVGVHCPLDVIEMRERENGNWPLFSARGQYEIVHQEISYHLEVDTHAESMDEIVAKILSYAPLAKTVLY